MIKTLTRLRMVTACVDEYFREQDKGGNVLERQEARASIHTGYRAVLDSKSTDESLASSLSLLLIHIALLSKLMILTARTLFTKRSGTLCKLGAKTLNALLQLPMAKVRAARVRSQTLCIYCRCTSWVSRI
jgi:hypothetical protein